MTENNVGTPFPVVQVHCSIPPSVAEQEMKLIEETVAAECCPETVRRIRETGAIVVRINTCTTYIPVVSCLNKERGRGGGGGERERGREREREITFYHIHNHLSI